MTNIEPTPTNVNQRGRRGSRVPLSSWELLTNVLVFTFGSLAVLASMGVFFVAQARGREKDRELALYQASAQIRIAEANATAATAKAEAERAKSLAIVAQQNLSEVAGKLNEAQAIRLFTDEKMAGLSHALSTLDLQGATVLAGGSAGAEAMARAHQVDRAISASGVPRPLGTGASGFTPPPGAQGDFVVTYYSGVRLPVVNTIVAELKRLGFVASPLKLKPDGPPMGEVQEPFVTLNVLPRSHPTF